MSRAGQCAHGWPLKYEDASADYGEGWLRPVSPTCRLCGSGKFAAGLPFKPGPPPQVTTHAQDDPGDDPALDGF